MRLKYFGAMFERMRSDRTASGVCAVLAFGIEPRFCDPAEHPGRKVYAASVVTKSAVILCIGTSPCDADHRAFWRSRPRTTRTVTLTNCREGLPARAKPNRNADSVPECRRF